MHWPESFIFCLFWAFVFINYLVGHLSEKFNILWAFVKCSWTLKICLLNIWMNLSSSSLQVFFKNLRTKYNPHLKANLFLFKPWCETASHKCSLILKVGQATIKYFKGKIYTTLKPRSSQISLFQNWTDGIACLS